MRLGKAPAYAILAVLDISRNQSGGPVQGRLIAEHHGIPAEYLLKVLQLLVKAKVLESETGRRGGFTMRRSPSDTTILELIEAVEGPLEGSVSLGAQFPDKHPLNKAIKGVCQEVAGFARERWRNVSVADWAALLPEPVGSH